MPLALGAFARVVAELGWQRDADKVVFAHTHQPLDGAVTVACDGARFWNTGSWIHAPTRGSHASYLNYLRRAWPGTGVLIDTERSEPILIEMLADQNPIQGSHSHFGGFRVRRPQKGAAAAGPARGARMH